MKLFDSAVHYGVGFWTGVAANEPEYRNGVVLLSLGFLAYQTISAWKKGDLGFPETKEYLVGLAGGLAYKRWKEWPEKKRQYILDTLHEGFEDIKGVLK